MTARPSGSGPHVVGVSVDRVGTVTAPTVSLTFDNGPTPGVTERVLDILARRGVPATFFVIGEKLVEPTGRAAALVERAVAEGHRVGGHTWSHSVPFGLLPDRDVDRELDDTRAAIERLGGDDRLFRPYGVDGAIDERLMSRHGARRLQTGGYTCVLWTSVPGDWLDPTGWPDVALADVAGRAWSVVVLHDLPVGAVDRLDEFVGRLQDLGADLRLDTPDDCTPVRAGIPTSSYALLGAG
jgi:peptidoglycan/xylan/chitin deacetylase (PgdA/CDA1 family)